MKGSQFSIKGPLNTAIAPFFLAGFLGLGFKLDTYLLGLFSNKIEYKKKKCVFLNITGIARILLAKSWKLKTLPLEGEIITMISETAELEKLFEYVNFGQMSKTLEKWDLWFKWRKN